MRHPSLTRGGLAIVAAAVVLLAGCSGAEPDPAPDAGTSDTGEQTSDASDEVSASSAPPESDTATQTQDGDAAAQTTGSPAPVTASDGTFTFELPERWVDAGSQVPDGMAAARASERTGDFFTNVVVTSQDPVGNMPESVEQAAKEIAGEDGEYEMLEASEIDGDAAYPFVLRRDQDGLTLAQTQYWVEHGGTLYLVTVSSAASEKEAADQAGQQVLDSWSWSD